jgi:hypothetical protein
MVGQAALGSVLLHYDGSTWAPATGSYNAPMTAGAAASSELVVGLARGLWSYEASAGWAAFSLPAMPGVITDAVALPSGEVFVLGTSGHMLHNP